MYNSIPLAYFDTADESIETLIQQTYEIYSPSQEKDWGTLAITVKRIH